MRMPASLSRQCQGRSRDRGVVDGLRVWLEERSYLHCAVRIYFSGQLIHFIVQIAAAVCIGYWHFAFTDRYLRWRAKKKKKTRRRRKEEQRQKEKKPKIINDKNVNNSMIACIWPVDLLLYNRPVKHLQFVVDFAGSRVGGRKTNPQLVLVLQWWIHIVFGLNHVQQKWLK